MSDSKLDYIQTWAEINLSNLNYNLNKVKDLISKDVKVLVTVKANAYGHGLIRVSKFLEDKVDILGVASVNEALLLKERGIKTDVLVMANTLNEGLKLIVSYDLIATVAQEETALVLDRLAREENKIGRLHIKVDTGMGRIGFWYEEAAYEIRKISKLKNIKVEGVFTHLSSAESDREFTLKQLKRFNEVIKQVENDGIDIPFYHAANSMATLSYKESHFNLIRPGLIIYGVYPDIECERMIEVHPVLSLKSKVVYLKEVEAGRSISYGREYITDKRTKIATVPIGYADGYTYLLSHKARVLIKGQSVPVIGRICMDQIMVDVTDIRDIKIGEEVVLIGSQAGNKITVEELAKLAGTIPYELLCGISQRVKRIYKD